MKNKQTSLDIVFAYSLFAAQKNERKILCLVMLREPELHTFCNNS